LTVLDFSQKAESRRTASILALREYQSFSATVAENDCGEGETPILTNICSMFRVPRHERIKNLLILLDKLLDMLLK